MATNGNQTCLEKRGMSERNEEVLRNDYNKENEYSSIHENATSNGTFWNPPEIKAYSVRRFGKCLCPDCQKKAYKAEA